MIENLETDHRKIDNDVEEFWTDFSNVENDKLLKPTVETEEIICMIFNLNYETFSLFSGS